MPSKHTTLKTILVAREREFPARLHERIMRRVLWLRLRTPLLLVFALLSVNILVSGWRLWARFVQLETLAFLRVVFSEFDVNMRSLSILIHSGADFIPISSLVVFTINLVLLAMTWYLVFLFDWTSLSHTPSDRLRES